MCCLDNRDVHDSCACGACHLARCTGVAWFYATRLVTNRNFRICHEPRVMLSLKGSGSLPKKSARFLCFRKCGCRVSDLRALVSSKLLCFSAAWSLAAVRTPCVKVPVNQVLPQWCRRQTTSDSDQNTPHSHSDARDRWCTIKEDVDGTAWLVRTNHVTEDLVCSAGLGIALFVTNNCCLFTALSDLQRLNHILPYKGNCGTNRVHIMLHLYSSACTVIGQPHTVQKYSIPCFCTKQCLTGKLILSLLFSFSAADIYVWKQKIRANSIYATYEWLKLKRGPNWPKRPLSAKN